MIRKLLQQTMHQPIEPVGHQLTLDPERFHRAFNVVRRELQRSMNASRTGSSAPPLARNGLWGFNRQSEENMRGRLFVP